MAFFYPQTFHPPTDLGELGYMAGVFDGEGSLSVRRYGQRKTTSMVYIAQKDRRMVDWLARFGGTVTACNKAGVHYWYLSSALNVLAFLQAVRPYLHTKADQTDVVLDELRTFDFHRLAVLVPNEVVEQIRGDLRQGDRQAVIARRYGVTPSFVCKVAHGWRRQFPTKARSARADIGVL